MKKYNEQFYEDRHGSTLHAAETILSIVQSAMPPIHSAVDVGCGVGSWLSILQNRGVQDILGIDGAWVNTAQLKIDTQSFMQYDLNIELKLSRRFDLAISLEVAEHLAPSHARSFVQSLTDLSDFVLFSAAVPGQGGTGHVNEQWQDYWMALFREQGYVPFDFIRGKTWNDPAIPLWYRQNIFLYGKGERTAEIVYPERADMPVCTVHPELYTRRVIQPGLFQALRILLRAVKKLFLDKKNRK